LETDRQLVQNVLRGDRATYARLVERYRRAAFAVALKVTCDRDAANDAAQSAFVSAYENLGRLRDPGAFGAWLLVIARREAVSAVRSRPTTVPLDDGHDRGVEMPPGESIGEGTSRSILAALGSLPEHEQQVVMLRYFDGRPVADIAAMTGRPVGTVTKQITRALRRLRERLEAERP